MKKTNVIVIAVILLILLLMVIWKSWKSNDIDSEQNNTNISDNAAIPDENFIACKVDGKKIVVSGFPLVTEFTNTKEAVVAASNIKGEYISLTIPLKQTGKLVNKVGALEEVQPKIHYTSAGQVSYENNWVESDSDISEINVTRYDSVVEGTFSGHLTRIDPDGWKVGEGVELTDCSFSIKEFTEYK